MTKASSILDHVSIQNCTYLNFKKEYIDITQINYKIQNFKGDRIMINQKLYLIPTTPSYEYEPYDHIYLVKAYSDQDAYNKAKSELDANIPKKLHEYESYNIVVYNLPTFPFHESKKYDILNPIFLSTKGFEHMAYFNVNWNDYINDLSELAAKEEWSSVTYPDKKNTY